MTSSDCPPLQERITRSLLGYGVIAGPFYVLLAAVQAGIRDGFDPARHAVSQLSLGSYGWIQVANFIITGLMTAAAGVGIGRAQQAGGAGRWPAAGLIVYGAGLVAAGILRSDPVDGFPPGTPPGPGHLSAHGVGHLVAATAGFLGLITSAIVLGAVFARNHHRRWAWFCRVTAILFGASFVYLASGSGGVWANLLFTAALLLTWVWLTMLSLHLYGQRGRLTQPDATPSPAIPRGISQA